MNLDKLKSLLATAQHSEHLWEEQAAATKLFKYLPELLALLEHADKCIVGGGLYYEGCTEDETKYRRLKKELEAKL